MNEKIIRGTCSEMCPKKERLFRIENNLVSTFECDDSKQLKVNESKMIKEYRRSAAGQSVRKDELRTEDALVRTLDYLVANIVDKFENNSRRTQQWYDFIWNRTRAIRKDITVQQLTGSNIIIILEKCARFHILCSYKLIEEKSDVFDWKINEENLVNCIQVLKEMYKDCSDESAGLNVNEFQSYHILINLDTENIAQEISKLDKQIRQSDQVQFAIRAFIAYKTYNYFAFTRLLAKSDLLQASILNRYLNKVRLNAVYLIRKACLVGNGKIFIPQDYFMKQLLFKENELKQFFKLINCDLESDKVVFSKGSELNLNANLKTNRNALIDKKFGKIKLSKIINGVVGEETDGKVDELMDLFKKVDFFNNC